jgi:alkaline phosphatase
MFGLLKNCKRFVALVLSTLFFSLGVLPGWQLPAYAGNGVNVILMIGDGMGWEMARAAAVANGAPMYTNGKGSGLAMQTLTGYGLVTTYGTTIKGTTTFSTGNSALDNSNNATGASPIRTGFTFNPAFNPGTTSSGDATSGGNLVGFDPDGFWLMIEGGDIDWAAHDDNMDNLIGNMLAFDEAVQKVITWIGNNGGWSKNLLMVTADHDHYLTLNPDFPTLLAATGAQDLTYNKHTPATAGYFHGSDPTIKYGWTKHSNRPVPVYYQGPANFMATLNNFVGQGYTFTDKRPGGPITNFNIPGVPGMVDQVHIYQTMLQATTVPATGLTPGRRTR